MQPGCNTRSSMSLLYRTKQADVTTKKRDCCTGPESLAPLQPLSSLEPPELTAVMPDRPSGDTSAPEVGAPSIQRSAVLRVLHSLRMKSDACIALFVGSASWLGLQLTSAHCFECWATKLLPAALLLAAASYLHERYRSVANKFRNILRAPHADSENSPAETSPTDSSAP